MNPYKQIDEILDKYKNLYPKLIKDDIRQDLAMYMIMGQLTDDNVKPLIKNIVSRYNFLYGYIRPQSYRQDIYTAQIVSDIYGAIEYSNASICDEHIDIERLLSTLTQVEKLVFTYSAGLQDGKSHSTKSTAKHYGLCKKCTASILLTAKYKLKKQAAIRKLYKLIFG